MVVSVMVVAYRNERATGQNAGISAEYREGVPRIAAAQCANRDACAVAHSAFLVRRGPRLGLRFFLQNRENETGSDDGKQPDELCLKHFLSSFEHAASENPYGQPRLE